MFPSDIAFSLQAIDLGVEGSNEFLDEIRLHEVGLEGLEHGAFYPIPLDAPFVGTGSLVAGVITCHVVLTGRGHRAAAFGANHETREQMSGSAVLPKTALASLGDGGRLPDPVKACLDAIPQFVIDDAEVRHLLDDPLVPEVGAGEAFASPRVFDVMLLVPDKTTNVEIIAEYACAPGVVPANGGVPPGTALRTGNAFRVEGLCNCPGRTALGELLKDSSDNDYLGLVGPSLAAEGLSARIVLPHDIVAIGVTTAGEALSDPSFETTAGLLGKILEEKCVHSALEADVEFVDLAFGQSDQFDLCKGEFLIEACDILLIAAETI